MTNKLVVVKKYKTQKTKPKQTGPGSHIRTAHISVHGTIVVYNTAQNSSDNLPLDLPDNHHSADNCLLERAASMTDKKNKSRAWQLTAVADVLLVGKVEINASQQLLSINVPV